MSLEFLFPHLRGFRLLSARREAKCLILGCERVTRTALCPVCGTAAHRIHSRYERTVRDLSIQNLQVILHLRVRKFYCDQPTCARRIFAERLPPASPSRDDLNRRVAEARAHLDATAFTAGWTAGQAMTEEQAITDALQDA